MGRYCGLKCVTTLVILKTLCFLLLQASPYFSQDQELEKEDAPSVVECCNWLLWESLSLNQNTYSKVYCRTEFSVDTVTLVSVSCTGGKKKKPSLSKRMVMDWLPCPHVPQNRKIFFSQLLRRRENDAFNAKHRSCRRSS